MKRLILAIAIIYGAAVSASAGTTVTDPFNFFAGTGLQSSIDQFQGFVDSYGPALSNAFALANIGGYPMGKATIGELPSFLIGISATAGLSNMEYFDSSAPKDSNLKPAVAPNPALFFGLGLGKGFDFMGKFMVFSNGFYNPPLNFSFFKLDKFNVVSVGGKLRYNIVKQKTIMPRVFNFGGITVSGGLDFLYGVISGGGKQKYSLKQVQVNGWPTPVDVDFDANYSAKVTWYIVSPNVEALAYIDFLFICSFYTGFGISGNIGGFHMTIDATGVATPNPAVVPAQTISVTSNNRYGPYYLMPVYIAGFDFNLYVTRISFETMVNLRNGKDVNIQLGFRTQF